MFQISFFKIIIKYSFKYFHEWKLLKLNYLKYYSKLIPLFIKIQERRFTTFRTFVSHTKPYQNIDISIILHIYIMYCMGLHKCISLCTHP